ncbi:MAG TPA: META domain-containing protein [Gemmatimonadaceae bacterium]|nr:META domain-containing protein [Gemmatimonadaceae bacterium]
MPVRGRAAVRWAAATWILSTLACGRSREVPREAEAAGRVTLDGTEWVVASLGGRPRLDGSNVTLTFAGETAGGYGGCNWYGGRYTVSGASVQIGEIESTARACGSPPGVGQQEERFYRTLRQVASYRVIDGRLEMLSRTSEVLLVLTPRARAAMDPAQLVGTRWRLRSVNDTLQGPDSPITLDLAAAGIGGFAGCRGYSGTYQARGDAINVTSIAMAATECDKGDAALLREGRFTTDLSEASHYRLSTDSLVIVTAPGHRLVFAAVPRLDQVVGDWEKPEETLPPIALTLRRDGDAMRARLRLSGSESSGRAVLEGTVLRLDLEGRPRQITGELVSLTELRLLLDPAAAPYRLVKKP